LRRILIKKNNKDILVLHDVVKKSIGVGIKKVDKIGAGREKIKLHAIKRKRRCT